MDHAISRRAIPLAFAVVALLGAGTATANLNVSQCKRLERQIDHYYDVAAMARDRGDKLWFDSTHAHIDRLTERGLRLCPGFEGPSQAEIMREWVQDTAKKAGKAFVKYLTFGAFP